VNSIALGSFSWHEVSSSDEELEFGDEDGIENEE